jgi:hypothetical protein
LAQDDHLDALDIRIKISSEITTRKRCTNAVNNAKKLSSELDEFIGAGQRVVDALSLEVEIFERFVVLEAGTPQSAVDLLGVSSLDLVGQQPQEKFGERQVIVDGLAHA